MHFTPKREGTTNFTDTKQGTNLDDKCDSGLTRCDGKVHLFTVQRTGSDKIVRETLTLSHEVQK